MSRAAPTRIRSLEAAITYRHAIPFALAPGKTDADAGSISALFKANMDQYRESRKRLGSTMERIYLQATPMGTIVIAYAEAERDFAGWLQALLSSDLEIDRRFIGPVGSFVCGYLEGNDPVEGNRRFAAST